MCKKLGLFTLRAHGNLEGGNLFNLIEDIVYCRHVQRSNQRPRWIGHFNK